MADKRDFRDPRAESRPEEAEPLKAGLSDISGVRKEDLQDAVANEKKSFRSTVEWVQSNYGVLIAAGLGVATVGFVTMWLNRRGGLRSFYEDESSPTLH